MPFDPPAEALKSAMQVAGLDDILKMPAFADVDDGQISFILESAAKFATRSTLPLDPVGDRDGATLRDGVVRMPQGFAAAYRDFVAAGWPQLDHPVELGGNGLPKLLSSAVTEIFAASNAAFALLPMLSRGAAEILARWADPALDPIYRDKLASGEWSGTMCLTEPQAGSDVGAVRTTATPAPDGSWRIRGQKIFISYGDHDMADNIVHLVLARTPESRAGTAGLSLFLVPKIRPASPAAPASDNDVRVVSIEHKMGMRAAPTCVLAFGDNDACAGWLVGKEHQGMQAMFVMMNDERLACALQAVGFAERAAQQSSQFASDRRQGRPIGRPDGAIAHHADVRRMLMTQRALTDAMRGVAYATAAALDRSRHHPDSATRASAAERAELLTPIAKAWCSDLATEVASLNIQIHGGVGYVEETGASQLYRDARITPIYEGTNGIQALDLVMRKLPANGGKALTSLLADMRRTAAGARPAWADAMHAGADAIERSSRLLIDSVAAAPRFAAAGASHFLHMTGYALGGQFLLDAADASPSGGAMADFFFSHLLPPVLALEQAIAAGDDPVFAGGDPAWA